MTSWQKEPGGIYVHIPFCVRKCPYCDFYSVTDLALASPFLDSLLNEMARAGDTPLTFDSLYIGGGTPSLLDSGQIRRILEKAAEGFSMCSDAEITIEVNPGTASPAQLRDYRRAGVNRINIGVQSFLKEHLDFLGRIHSGQEAYAVVEWAREAGFENLGLDLIYGIPGQSRDAWLSDMQEAVRLMPEHISCYMLSYEEGTLMGEEREAGLLTPMADPLLADLFEATGVYLGENGYAQYEISNHARSDSAGPGANRSRHNQKYWSFAPYLGFGPSAHSFVEPVRSWNVSSVKEYVERANSGQLPMAGKETLGREQQMIEWVYLGLRQTDGIEIGEFDRRFDVSFHAMFGETLGDLLGKGLIEPDATRCKLTRKGMLLLDSIASALIADC